MTNRQIAMRASGAEKMAQKKPPQGAAFLYKFFGNATA